MKTVFIVILFLCCLNSFTQNIHYVFAAPNANHHEAEISLTAEKIPPGPALFRMSRSSPGRYATHEYGKNVYNVKAVDGDGKTLQLEKADADVYKVSGHHGTIKITYTLFANYADGTYAGIDATGYHLNMPATFMWLKGMDKLPVTVQFIPVDKDWKVATQLKPTADPFTFTAPGLQYFMDSPTKIGSLQFRQWTMVNPDNKEYTIRLALEADATETLVDSFANKVRKVVEQAKAVYGELPAYDYGTYTFIASINPYVKGDGMEHRNSTMISIPQTFDGSNGLLGVFAHEFFHCWNVERIRPYQLEPFNFEKSNMSEALWLAEGFTQYYGDLLMKRAGLTSEDEYLGDVAGLINTKMNRPGAQDYSPIENSQRAVFVDAGVSIDKTNYANMYASYYTYGGAIALALDLDLRSNFKISLDHFMRSLWLRHGKTEKPYSIPDLQAALASITNRGYADTFFKKYVYGHEPFDYSQALSPAGMQLTPASQGKAWVGPVNFVSNGKDLMISGNTIKNTPLYNAGADADDILLKLGDKDLHERKDFDEALAAHSPGEKVTLVFKHRNKLTTADISLVENNNLRVKLLQPSKRDEKAGAFRKAWMSGQTNSMTELRGSTNR